MAGLRVRVTHVSKLRIAEKLKRIAGGNLRRAVNLQSAKWTQNRVKSGFVSQSDPYGDRWAPKKRPDGRKILSGKTKQLKRTITVTPNPTGFRLHAAAPYASFHQDGRRKSGPDIPTRMFFPTKEKGLPEKWQKQYLLFFKREVKALSR